jgi:hypothetical protein
VTPLTDRQRELLAKLCQLSEQLEGYRATVAMLEHERFRLQTELRQSGFQPSAPDQPELAL